jgi:hypothetical protein
LEVYCLRHRVGGFLLMNAIAIEVKAVMTAIIIGVASCIIFVKSMICNGFFDLQT